MSAEQPGQAELPGQGELPGQAELPGQSDLSGRSLCKELDLDPVELTYLLDLADVLKAAKRSGTEKRYLQGRNIAAVFEKTSTRTRAAFEVAAHDQGAQVTTFDPSGSQIGHKESAADTARVLGRMFDAIQFRGTHQNDVETMAKYSGVPVYNGLTDDWHPTQMLADFQTMREASGKPANCINYAFLGDLRFNMARSHAITAALLGAELRLAGPPTLWLPDDVMETANRIAADTGARILVTDDPVEAVRDVDFVHTDVWVSMGEPADTWASRVTELLAYRVDAELMARAGDGARFMHCLPAYHDEATSIGAEIASHTGVTGGLEVTHDVFESSRSIVFDQAENRLHTIKALMVATLA